MEKHQMGWRAFWVAAFFIVLFVFGWHLFVPLGLAIGGALAGFWVTVLASIVCLSVLILLAFLFTGVGLILISVFGFVWVLAAVAFFPVAFPILVPLLIVLFVASICRRRS